MKKKNMKTLALHRLTISNLIKGRGVKNVDVGDETRDILCETQADTVCMTCAVITCTNESEYSCKVTCWDGAA
jgi:hypothetical protein